MMLTIHRGEQGDRGSMVIVIYYLLEVEEERKNLKRKGGGGRGRMRSSGLTASASSRSVISLPAGK